MTPCPHCGARGRAIPSVTLQHHVVPARRAQIIHEDGWSLCTDPECDVVYFRLEDAVRRGEVIALPYLKDSGGSRLVCFCFEHSVEAVEEDVHRHGSSTLRATIAAACAAGQDDCARKNPQGRCCLGDLDRLVARASTPDDEPDCCRAPTGAGASACCGGAGEADPHADAPHTTGSDQLR